MWCVRGLSYSTVSWAHLGNVPGVKSGEPGAYYVTSFLQFGNRRLLARPGRAAPFDGGTTFGFGAGCPVRHFPIPRGKVLPKRHCKMCLTEEAVRVHANLANGPVQHSAGTQ